MKLYLKYFYARYFASSLLSWKKENNYNLDLPQYIKISDALISQIRMRNSHGFSKTIKSEGMID